tara:strand:+ start:56 stop:511 length:456 start_codon:yes stop_codon:yes gene_type:complete
VTDWGAWREGGKMPRTAFYLSKPRGRSYRLPSYRWRVVCFEALGKEFRLLIAYRTDKEQYRAVLAIDHGRDMAVLAQYEFHGTHPGWHVLATCDDVESAPTGMMRHPWQRRIPKARGDHRKTAFRVANDDHALAVASDAFRLHRQKGNLGL